jgi:hypothetical protein
MLNVLNARVAFCHLFVGSEKGRECTAKGASARICYTMEPDVLDVCAWLPSCRLFC